MSDFKKTKQVVRYFPIGASRIFRVFTGVAVALVGQVATAALPLPPPVFLDAMPEVPEGWELTVSRGRASIANEGGYSHSERRYVAGDGVRAKAALQAAEEGVPMGPLAVNVQASDAAMSPLVKVEFMAWQETGVDSRLTGYLRLAGHKAIVSQPDNGPLQVAVLVNDRFVFKLEFAPAATIEQATPWVAGIDAKALARYRHDADFKVKGKEELSLTTDELNHFKYVMEINGEMKEVETPTRSYRTKVREQSEREARALREAIASGEIPGEPTAEDYEKMKEVRKRLEGSGGYDPEADLKEMQERGLLPKPVPQPGLTPDAAQ
jgi:hypothetical protein